MTALESMTDKLSALEIYNITDESNIKTELKVYAEALERHRNNIDEVLRECFITSACDYGLELREKVVGDIKTQYSLSKRREMLSIRKGFNETDFSVNDIGKFIRGLGVTEFNISENPAQNVMSVCIGGSYPDSEAKWIKKQIQEILPAHLQAFVYFGGKTWHQYQTSGRTFAELDALDLTWKEIHLQ